MVALTLVRVLGCDWYNFSRHNSQISRFCKSQDLRRSSFSEVGPARAWNKINFEPKSMVPAFRRVGTLHPCFRSRPLRAGITSYERRQTHSVCCSYMLVSTYCREGAIVKLVYSCNKHGLPFSLRSHIQMCDSHPTLLAKPNAPPYTSRLPFFSLPHLLTHRIL